MHGVANPLPFGRVQRVLGGCAARFDATAKLVVNEIFERSVLEVESNEHVAVVVGGSREQRAHLRLDHGQGLPSLSLADEPFGGRRRETVVAPVTERYCVLADLGRLLVGLQASPGIDGAVVSDAPGEGFHVGDGAFAQGLEDTGRGLLRGVFLVFGGELWEVLDAAAADGDDLLRAARVRGVVGHGGDGSAAGLKSLPG